MAYENINLFFARDKNNNIITIDKINKENKHDDYTCPICGSSVIARTGQVVTHHFAHQDKSQCDSETQIHFWIKNELIKQGDKFKIRLDKDTIKEFICKEVLIEQQYKTEFGTYKPDITIITESDETIYFEVAKTNKKKLEDYLDQWLELGNIVVEVETKDLINGNKVKEFKSLFYDGKCFNVNKEDKDYYETIGNIKTGFKKGLYTKEEMDSISWLWKDMNKYMIGKLDIETLSYEIQSIKNERLKEVIVNVLRKKSCNKILEDYVEYNIDKTEKLLNSQEYIFYFKCVKTRKVYERVFCGCDANLYYEDKALEKLFVHYNDTLKILDEYGKDILLFAECKIYTDNRLQNNNNNGSYISYGCNYYEESKIVLNNFTGETYYNGYGNLCNNAIMMEDKTKDELLKELDKYIDKQLNINEQYTKNIEIINNMVTQLKNTIKGLEKIEVLNEHIIYIHYWDNILSYNINNCSYKNHNINHIEKIQNSILENIFGKIIKEIKKDILARIYYRDNFLFVEDKQVPITDIVSKIKYDITQKDYIINMISKKVKNIIDINNKYKNIFDKYSHICKNTKNSYNIDVWRNEVSINYRGNKVFRICYSEISNIYSIINNKYFKMAIKEDIEDYKKYGLIYNVVCRLNKRYQDINNNWSVDKWDEDKMYINTVDRYGDKNIEFGIEVLKNSLNEDELFDYCIDKFGVHIRRYLYK